MFAVVDVVVQIKAMHIRRERAAVVTLLQTRVSPIGSNLSSVLGHES